VKGLTAPGGNKKIRKLGRVWSFILAFLGLKDKLQASRVLFGANELPPLKKN
jgi:hypothetical protein